MGSRSARTVRVTRRTVLSPTRVIAPGRVNLIGDHTDYVGGLALPCAIDLAVTADIEVGGDFVDLSSDATAEIALFELSSRDRAPESASAWLRIVHAVAALVPHPHGVTGRLTTTLPIGAGLSSSAACTIALALALGFDGGKNELVLLAQAAEQRATGVPCGVLDQLAIVFGQAGYASLVDAGALTATPVRMPADASVVVVPSGQVRNLADTPYATRRDESVRAVAEMGGVTNASMGDAQAISDPLLRHRARHVLSENERVRGVAEAFARNDAKTAGALMLASHTSLRDDAEVSTHDLDSLVDALSSRRGVHGARMTGAGFGGSVVALTSTDAAPAIAATFGGRVVVASDGARRVE